MSLTGSCHCGKTKFRMDAEIPAQLTRGSTRRIGVNARLFDDFDAALASLTVTDGKHLW